MKIVEYYIVCSADANDLAARVNDRISSGWQPWGILNVVYEGGCCKYRQAIVRHEDMTAVDTYTE